MKSKEYVLVNIYQDKCGFQNISKSGNLDLYLTSNEYDKLYYEFDLTSIILIFEASLDDDIKEMIHKSFQNQITND